VDVFVGDDGDGHAVGAGAAGGEEGKDAGPVDDLVVSDCGEEGSAAFDGFEAGGGGGGGGEDVAGEVDQVVAVVSDRAAGNDGNPAGAQGLGGGGDDLGEAVEEAVPAGVGEVPVGRRVGSGRSPHAAGPRVSLRPARG
jgi:hypothetical protein